MSLRTAFCRLATLAFVETGATEVSLTALLVTRTAISPLPFGVPVCPAGSLGLSRVLVLLAIGLLGASVLMAT